MFFTQEDYRKIEKWLLNRAVKDTQMISADELGGEEFLAIIQDSENKLISLSTFVDDLTRLVIEDVVIQDDLTAVEESLQESIDTLNELLAALQEALNSETEARESADETLQTNIDNEASTREAADEELEELIMALYPVTGYYESTYSSSSSVAANINTSNVVYLGTTYSTEDSTEDDYWDRNSYEYLWYYNGKSWGLANKRIGSDDTGDERLYFASTSYKYSTELPDGSTGTSRKYPAGFICVYDSSGNAVYSKYYGTSYFLGTTSSTSNTNGSLVSDDFTVIESIYSNLIGTSSTIVNYVNQYEYVQEYSYIWYIDCSDYTGYTVAQLFDAIDFTDFVLDSSLSSASTYVDNVNVFTFGNRNVYNMASNWVYYANDASSRSDDSLVSLSAQGALENWENPFWVERFLLNCVYLFYETNPDFYSTMFDRLLSNNTSFHIRGGYGGYCDIYLGNLNKPEDDDDNNMFSSIMRFSGRVSSIISSGVAYYGTSGVATTLAAEHIIAEFVTNDVYIKGLNGSNVDSAGSIQEKQTTASSVLDMFELGLAASRAISLKVTDIYKGSVVYVRITKSTSDANTETTSDATRVVTQTYNTVVTDANTLTSTSYIWTRTLNYTYSSNTRETLSAISETYTIE